MNLLDKMMTLPMVDELGWVVLHFLWQGAAVAVVLIGALALMRSRTANARYLVCCGGMLAMLALPVGTFLVLLKLKPEPIALSIPDLVVSGDGVATSESTLATLLPVLTMIWLLGAAGLQLRMLLLWARARRLSRVGLRPAPINSQRAVIEMCTRLAIARRVRVMESTLAAVPMLIGWARPIILLPATTLTGLSPAQLRAVIAHELAHVRRHDYLVNLIQCVLESVLFYHPAVWWLSRRLRTEREYCCDDLAVTACGDALCYARALSSLATLRAEETNLVLASTGGSLMTRISRIAGIRSHGRARWAPMVVAASVIAGVSTMSFALTADPAPVTLNASDDLQAAREQLQRVVKEIAEAVASGEITSEEAQARIEKVHRALESLKSLGDDQKKKRDTAEAGVKKKAAEQAATSHTKQERSDVAARAMKRAQEQMRKHEVELHELNDELHSRGLDDKRLQALLERGLNHEAVAKALAAAGVEKQQVAEAAQAAALAVQDRLAVLMEDKDAQGAVQQALAALKEHETDLYRTLAKKGFEHAVDNVDGDDVRAALALARDQYAAHREQLQALMEDGGARRVLEQALAVVAERDPEVADQAVRAAKMALQAMQDRNQETSEQAAKAQYEAAKAMAAYKAAAAKKAQGSTDADQKHQIQMERLHRLLEKGEGDQARHLIEREVHEAAAHAADIARENLAVAKEHLHRLMEDGESKEVIHRAMEALQAADLQDTERTALTALSARHEIEAEAHTAAQAVSEAAHAQLALTKEHLHRLLQDEGAATEAIHKAMELYQAHESEIKQHAAKAQEMIQQALKARSGHEGETIQKVLEAARQHSGEIPPEAREALEKAAIKVLEMRKVEEVAAHKALEGVKEKRQHEGDRRQEIEVAMQKLQAEMRAIEAQLRKLAEEASRQKDRD